MTIYCNKRLESKQKWICLRCQICNTHFSLALCFGVNNKRIPSSTSSPWSHHIFTRAVSFSISGGEGLRMDVGIWGLAAKLFLNCCTCAEEEPWFLSVGFLIRISQECDCHRKWTRRGSQGIPGDRCCSSTGKAEGRGMPGHSGSWLVLQFLDTTLSFYSSPPLEESVCWRGVLKAAPVKAAIITLRGWTVAA